jgi:hypothetical protein
VLENRTFVCPAVELDVKRSPLYHGRQSVTLPAVAVGKQRRTQKGRGSFPPSPDNSFDARWSPVSRTIQKIPHEALARPEEDRNLAGATVNAPGAELANSSHSHECVVDPRLQAVDGRRAIGGIGFSDVVLGGARGGDDGHVDVLARRKILISVQKMKRKKGEGEVMKVEGIPETHNLPRAPAFLVAGCDHRRAGRKTQRKTKMQ